MKFEFDDIKKIVELLNKNSLSEISIKEGEHEVTIKKEVTSNKVNNQQTEKITEHKEIEQKEPSRAKNAIISPMVGSYYASPTPGSKPFVKVGDTVSEGQVVCIIEAMKLMNEIESDISGKVTEICVQDGQSVEYGQVLMYVE